MRASCSWTGVDGGTERRMGRANRKSEYVYEKIGVGLISDLQWEVEVSLTEALWLELEQELYLCEQTEVSVRSEEKMWECQQEGLMGDWGRLSWQ